MKTASKEISRNIKKELACVNMTVTIIAMVLSVVTGVLFAIGGIDGEAWEEICTPVWALHPVILVIFFDHVFLAASPVRKADADGIYTLCVRLCFDLHMDPAYI